MKKIWIFASAMALVFASCSQDQETPKASTKGDVALSLKGSASDMVVTRASTVDLPASTQVGVYVLETSPTGTTLTSTAFKNGLYTAVGSGGAFTSTTPFYLNSSNTYSALAYAPYQSSISDPAVVSFAHGTDVLYASSQNVSITGTSPSFAATTALTFVHQMSQIQFTLVAGTGSPVLTGASLSVTGFDQSCTMNLNDGTITSVLGSGAAVTNLSKAVCFVPGALNLNVSVTTTDGRVYNGTLSQTFLAGNSYSYTITLNKNDTKLGITGTVVDWIPVNGGSIPIEG